MKASDITDVTVDAFGSVKAFASNLVQPTIRLGVTGLARSGKTVFITSLIHNLMTSGRMPFFDAAAEARIQRIYLEPQPDDAVPRFDYEQHIADLTGPRARLAAKYAALEPSAHHRRVSTAKLLETAIRLRPAARRHRRLSGRVAARPPAA